MYIVIGADGREYGPVDETKVRQWIAQGRVNGSTKVRVGEELKRAGEIPTFADALRTSTHDRSGSCDFPETGLHPLAGMLTGKGRALDLASCFSRAWDLVKSRFWLATGVCFLLVAALIAIYSIPVIGFVVVLAFGYVFIGGVYWVFLKLVRRQPADVSDVLVSFGVAFVPLILLSLVSQSLMTVGFMLLFIPGLYVMLVYGLFPALLVIDKGLDFWPAMETSRKVVHAQFFQVAVFALLSLALLLGGVLMCLVGFFVTLPVCIAATVYAYEDLFGREHVPGCGVT
jgi:hypothetical protein